MGWHRFFSAKVHTGREPAPAPEASNPNRRRNHRVSGSLPAFVHAYSGVEMFEQGQDH
jgi:hypothetical protein